MNLPRFYQIHLQAQLKRSEYLILSILLNLLQSYRWVRLEELATKFPQNILFESRRRKLQRFLSIPQLTIAKIWWPIFTYWLNQTFDSTEVLSIAIDRTQWRTVNLLMISLIYQRRAIPIYFEILPKLGCCNVEQQKSVLSLVLPLLQNYTIVVLGDREFCSVDLAAWLRKQSRTYFCLRLRRNEYIEIAADIWIQLKALGLSPGVSLY